MKIIVWHKPLVAQQHVRRHFAGYKLRDLSFGGTFNKEVVRRVSKIWSDDMSTEVICLLKRCGVLQYT